MRNRTVVPTVFVTLGDPGGIGPEVVVRSLSDKALLTKAIWVVVGSEAAFRRALDACGKSIEYSSFSKVIPDFPGTPSVILVEPGCGRLPAVGESCKEGGEWAGVSVELAVEAILRIGYGSLVTAPLAKGNLLASGRNFPGHTEMLAALCGVRNPMMLLANKSLRVALFTRHIALRKVFRTLKTSALFDDIELLSNELTAKFGIRQPRIAVLGLNPHAGEGGMFGNEEKRIIEPAIRKAQKKGISAFGPLPPDTAFTPSSLSQCDCVLAMYHDQGLAAFKALAFDNGVNITLNLPFLRTSPDHGTAFDIAPQFRANPASMTAAMHMALAHSCK